GDEDRLIIGIIQIMLLGVLLLIGNKAELGGMYYVGLAAATILGIYQQFLIRNREPAQCLQAFLNNHWLGAAVFTGLLAHYLCY
ncbi:MAG: 4-hydroxybenzoate octaprenyltransferase, partial [Gammaproteobacteria bacterium]